MWTARIQSIHFQFRKYTIASCDPCFQIDPVQSQINTFVNPPRTNHPVPACKCILNIQDTKAAKARLTHTIQMPDNADMIFIMIMIS